VVTGDYESLRAQEFHSGNHIERLAFTDNPEARDFGGWKVVYTPLLFSSDPIRSQRVLKILPHKYLPDFDSSIYVDNTVNLLRPATDIFDEVGADESTFIRHSFHATIRDEYRAVVTGEILDDPRRLLTQLEDGLKVSRNYLNLPVNWTGLMVRSHRNMSLNTALERWAMDVLIYSRRDQLSSSLHVTDTLPRVKFLEIDNLVSAWHSWPHYQDRKHSARVFQIDSRDSEDSEFDPILRKILSALDSEIN
jgi:hypothetical protein